MINTKRLLASVMIGGVLLASCLAPAQAVLADTATGDTSSTPTTTTTAPAPDSSTQTQNAPVSNTPTSPSINTPAGSPTSSTSNTPSSSNTPTSNPTQSTQSSSAAPDSVNTQTSDAQDVKTLTNENARSGDINAVGNLSSVGNSTSGNATNVDTQVTSLNSTASLNQKGGLQTFTFNINGNHVGDIVLSPAQFLQSSAATAVLSPENANVTTETDSTITNTIDLSAASGNVTVAGNLGNVGDATSGNAATELNLINMISSTVSDKQAFVGMVNINGSLKGNLLLPKSAVDQLLPAAPTASVDNTTTTTNNMTVNNNVTLDATSGNVSVVGNGGASGSIASGDSDTNVKLYNLTNEKIVGGNVLLVFVNVEGSWVGLLMNAPAGTTTAALGGGITQNLALTNSATTTTNQTINNNINLSSKSGNVKVQGNLGKTGNARSGNASANADIVNILGSQVDLSGWLGVLVINVYGSWNGSLEIQPAQVTIHVKTPPVHHTVKHANKVVHHTVSKPAAKPLTHTKLTAAHLPGNLGAKPAFATVPAKPGLSHRGKSLMADATLAGVGAILAVTSGAFQFITHRRKN